MAKPLIQKGYDQVRKNDKKFGTNKDCRNCRFHPFDECKNPEVTEYDMVEDMGRKYCGFFEETPKK